MIPQEKEADTATEVANETVDTGNPKVEKTVVEESEQAVDVQAEAGEQAEVSKEPASADAVVYDDDFKTRVVSYFKENGREVESLEDLLKAPEPEIKEVVKEVNPYEGVKFDEEDLQYLKFKKETNRSRKEFDVLNQDLDALSPIDLAKQRIEKETGQKFSRQEVIEYLEEKFDMNLSEMDNLSVKDKIELQSFVKPTKDELVALKETYKQPIEVASQSPNKDDYVTLENGSIVPKAKYEEETNIRTKYLEQVNNLSNGVDGLSFKFGVDDNGVKKEVDFSYEISQQDTQEMVSKLSDINATLKQHFSTKTGAIDVRALGIALQFGSGNKLEKLLDTAYQRGRADLAEATTKTVNNVNYSPTGTPRKNGEQYATKKVTVDELLKR